MLRTWGDSSQPLNACDVSPHILYGIVVGCWFMTSWISCLTAVRVLVQKKLNIDFKLGSLKGIPKQHQWWVQEPGVKSGRYLAERVVFLPEDPTPQQGCPKRKNNSFNTWWRTDILPPVTCLSRAAVLRILTVWDALNSTQSCGVGSSPPPLLAPHQIHPSLRQTGAQLHAVLSIYPLSLRIHAQNLAPSAV